MTDDSNRNDDASPDAAEDSGPDNFFIDILTGNKEAESPKKLLVQKVLRQLIESYGFDRADIAVDYRHRIKGGKPASIDIAIFRPGAEHDNADLQRIIVCKTQKKRDKLRSLKEAESDWRTLKDLLELKTGATLGLWTNGQEEFLFQVERTRFEDRLKPLGVWPATPSARPCRVTAPAPSAPWRAASWMAARVATRHRSTSPKWPWPCSIIGEPGTTGRTRWRESDDLAPDESL